MDIQEPALPIAADPIVLVVMGVSGCGKTTVAALLAERLGWPFEEGDALHPQANIEKMAAGHPLSDADRWPWLEKVAEWVDGRLDEGQNGGTGISCHRNFWQASSPTWSNRARRNPWRGLALTRSPR